MVQIASHRDAAVFEEIAAAARDDHASSNTWSYVVSDPATHTAAIIDPVLDFDAASGRVGTTSATALLDHVERNALQVRWLLETHAHADHLSAGRWLKGRLPDATLAIGVGIREVQARFRPLFNADFAIDGSQFDHLFADGATFEVGTLAARIIAVPGHTPDSIAYLVGDALFTGDSLFMRHATADSTASQGRQTSLCGM